MKKKRGKGGKACRNVLVGVLKSESDLNILLDEKWYRVPLEFLPTRSFTYLAFYQPACFGRSGKCIRYYAKVEKKEMAKRVDLLPEECMHPRAGEVYAKFLFRKVETLETPVRNIIPRRISFGFTDLRSLRSARDILQLYGIAPTEVIIARRLKGLGLSAITEYPVKDGKKRYRIDLAILCANGNIAIECDNIKAHASKIQKEKDKAKDAALEKLGWTVFRFQEPDIMEHPDALVSRIQAAVLSLGGTTSTHS